MNAGPDYERDVEAIRGMGTHVNCDKETLECRMIIVYVRYYHNFWKHLLKLCKT